ncbi:TM2 domain-containing protein almondex isoform X2 [Copidosoma floridanum]|uniref:TM2 domain-containing protein almondex isoform X2 n=1 Tax=Copidosoma floridanum TaxID=29053 RepID=UPI0006C9A564|nr:TM2 domain-containing protein almondex isoform X2 [Copidosoma floridanum]
MLVVRINVRNVAYIILAILLTSVREAYMGYGDSISNHAININSTPTYGSKKIELFGLCPAGTQCSELSVECLNCTLDFNCVYGSVYEAQCSVIDQVDCKGEIKFKKQYICRYCYQTEHWEHDCYLKNSCSSFASPQQYYRWSTALILSITLGGFGADRFYLGHWQEGIGKLFSFGGLGVWTLIDVMLISMRYLGPADGSLYV